MAVFRFLLIYSRGCFGFQDLVGEDDEESVGKNTMQSPCSSPVEENTEKDK